MASNEQEKGNSLLRTFATFTVLLAAAIGVLIYMQSQSAKFNWGSGRDASRVMTASVPPASVDAFYSRLEDFAKARNFLFSRSRIHPEKPQYSIDLERHDVSISGDNVFDLNVFSIAFYFDANTGGSAEVVATISSELQKAILEIPGTEVSSKGHGASAP